MTITYRKVQETANEHKFANPLAFFDTVSIRVNVQPKKAGPSTVYNAASAINMQRTLTLPGQPGCTDKCAPISTEKAALRFSLSGSTQSKEAIKALIADFRLILELYEDDLVSGFLTNVSELVLDAA